MKHTDKVVVPFEESMSRIEDFIGQKALAALVHVVPKNLATLRGDAIAGQKSSLPSPSSADGSPQVDQYYKALDDEDSIEEEVENGNLPDTAIVRELLRQAKAREVEQRGSRWIVPRKPRPFNSTSKAIPYTKAEDGAFKTANLPFKPRLESLYHRCRLMILEDAAYMVGEIKKLEASKHTDILLQGLRFSIVTEAQEIILRLDVAIADCASKHLKRLEIEFRLIQISIHTVLHSLEISSGVDIQASAKAMVELCQQYPDTAGVFWPTCSALKRAVDNGSRQWNFRLYTKISSEFWKKWAGHEVGYLRHCINGHPYSGYVFSDCPECGRYVELPQEDKTDYQSFLKEDQFLAKMKTMRLGSKWASTTQKKEATGDGA